MAKMRGVNAEVISTERATCGLDEFGGVQDGRLLLEVGDVGEEEGDLHRRLDGFDAVRMGIAGQHLSAAAEERRELTSSSFESRR